MVTKTLYLRFWALVDELICEQPTDVPKSTTSEKMMTFEWYTVCFMSTLSLHGKKCSRHKTEHIIIYVLCVWPHSITTKSQSRTHIIAVPCMHICCYVKHDIFLIWDKISHQILIYLIVAVATLCIKLLLTWLSMYKIKPFSNQFRVRNAHTQWNSIRFYRFPFDSLHAPNGNKGNDTLTKPKTVPEANVKWKSKQHNLTHGPISLSLAFQFQDHILSIK